MTKKTHNCHENVNEKKNNNNKLNFFSFVFLKMVHILVFMRLAWFSFRMNWVLPHIWHLNYWKTMRNRWFLIIFLHYISSLYIWTCVIVQWYFNLILLMCSVFLWGATMRSWAPLCSSLPKSLTRSERHHSLINILCKSENWDFAHNSVFISAQLLSRRSLHSARRRHDVPHHTV